MRLLPCLATVALIAPVAALEPVPDVPPPASWEGFTVLMYQAYTEAPRDQALYEALNLHAFHIDRRNDDLVEFARRTKWSFYVDHAADKGYLHLGDNGKDPKVAAVNGKRGLVQRPNSLADPATIEKLHGFLKDRVAAAKGAGAVGYAFDDEIGLGDFCTPVETDGHPLAIAFFRKQLAERYKDVAALNAQYGTKYASFDEIQPTTFEQVRGQLTKAGIGAVNLSAWCDWRSAMDTHFAEVLADLTRVANAVDPTVPAGFVGGQAPNAWGGYDWRKLCQAVQWVECYDIGGSNEVLRSFWSQKRPHVQTFFSSRDPKLDAWFLWYYLCQGNRGVIAWPEGWFQDGKPAPHIASLADTFKEVQGPVSRAIIDGEFAADPIALYYSQPSIQMSWALDAACHGGTWPNRRSSMDNSISTGGLSRIAWLKSLQDVGVQPTFVHQDDLLAGLGKRGIKALVLSRALCLSDAEVAAIRAFANGGGAVIADHCCGLFDEHGKARAAGALDDLFGVKRDPAKGWFDGEALTEVDGERGGQLNAETWARGAPRAHGVAVVERGLSGLERATAASESGTAIVVRQGKATYLNLSPIGYLMHRSDEGGKPWRDLVAQTIADAGIKPRVALTTDGQPAALTEALFWKNGDRTTVCVVKNLDRGAKVDGFGTTTGGLGDGTVSLGLRFQAPVKDLRNERTGAKLGDGAAFTDRFTPWEANVYSFAK